MRRIDKVKRHREIKRQCIAYLGGKCFRCNLDDDFPEIYDFHHEGDKAENISHMIGRIANRNEVFKIESMKQELDKCKIICSNCHRKHHYEMKMQAILNGDTASPKTRKNKMRDAERKAIVVSMLDKGYRPKHIASRLDITPRAVYMLIDRMRTAERLTALPSSLS